MPAIDHDGSAGHEGAGVGAEQQQRAIEILGLAQPALRHAPDQLLARRRLPERPVEVGLDIARRQGVDLDAVARSDGRYVAVVRLDASASPASCAELHARGARGVRDHAAMVCIDLWQQ